MLHRQNHHCQRGFTLAEILVTTAIFAIIMIAALAVYDQSNRVFKSSTESADLQQSTRIGFDKLVSDVRMAGFDYSRGGVPTNGYEATQPDEQIEYAGPAAVVFRANFNYNVGTGTCTSGATAPCGNGLEPAYTPHNVKGQAIFPYVTTSNQEIIAYVLQSTNAAANNQSISFYADDYKPRAAFPANIQPAPAGGNPSNPEAVVTIPGIDLTNANPPYTLYRVTLNDSTSPHQTAAAFTWTPVAENIRSLNLQYFTDLNGTTLLTNADGTAITAARNADGSTIATTSSGAIGGDGQYDPNNVGAANNFGDRNQRALIASMRISLVGLNASPDLQGYTHPTETIASIQKYRQYSLSSLVVPRNLGLTGFPEPSFNPPAPPTIIGMCTGHCGAPVIYWAPPAVAGDVTKYRVEWDISPNGAFSNGKDITDPTLTSYIIPDDGTLTPSTKYYFQMRSYNDNGASPPSAPPWPAVPQNATKPQAPTFPSPAGTSGLTNQIPLKWIAPSNNQSPKDQLACAGPAPSGSTSATVIPSPQEIVKFRVYRGQDNSFDPNNASDPGVQVLGYTSASQPAQASGGAQVSWIDSGTTSTIYPANCTPYYYKVVALDRCYSSNSYNVSANTADSISTPSAIIGPFQSTSAVAPAVPGSASIDRTTPNASGCPDPDNPSSPNCKVTLNWPAVITDIATPANVIGIDRYVISRASRLQQAGGAYVADTTFVSPGFSTAVPGSVEINCPAGSCIPPTLSFSQLNPSATRSYVDHPPFLNNGGQVLEYLYTVASKNCSLYSGASPYGIVQAAQGTGTSPPGLNPSVAYPGCSTNPSIVEAGAQNPLGTGNSPAQAWIFNQGDQAGVIPSAGSTVNSVVFQLFTWPTPVQVGSTITINSPGNAAYPPAIAPYIYTWNDQTGTDTYTMRITLNTIDAQGNPCQEVHVKYITQQSPAPCFFANVVPPAPSTATHVNHPKKEVDPVFFTVTNVGTEPIKFNILAQSFQGNITLTWHSPDLPNHTDLQLTQIVWGVPSASYANTDSICAFSATQPPGPGGCTAIGSNTVTLTRSVPATMPDVPVGQTFTIELDYAFDGSGNNPSLPASPSAITKLCVKYRILSEQTVNKNCNLVGQSGSTQNPTNCD